MRLTNMVVRTLANWTPMTTEEVNQLKIDAEAWYEKYEEGSMKHKIIVFLDVWYMRATWAVFYIVLYYYLWRIMNPNSNNMPLNPKNF